MATHPWAFDPQHGLVLSKRDLTCVLLTQEHPPQGCDFRSHLASTVQGQGGRDPQNLEEQSAENPATGEVPSQPGPPLRLLCLLRPLLPPTPPEPLWLWPSSPNSESSHALTAVPPLSCGPITDTHWWPTPMRKPGIRCCSGGRRPGSWSRRCVPGSVQLPLGTHRAILETDRKVC